MIIEARTRLNASLDKRIFYRGLNEAWNDEKAKKQHIIFVTTDRDYALEYAKDEDHLLAFHVDLGHSFSLGFRSLQTSVSLDEVVARVRQGVMSQFKSNKISKDVGLDLVTELRVIKASGHKEVWEWYMQEPNLVQILKLAKYNSLEGYEGLNHDIPTWGLFSHTQLKPVRNQ